MVDDWNSLPSKVVEARDVEQFRAELDEPWKDGERYMSKDFLLLDVFDRIRKRDWIGWLQKSSVFTTERKCFVPYER